MTRKGSRHGAQSMGTPPCPTPAQPSLSIQPIANLHCAVHTSLRLHRIIVHAQSVTEGAGGICEPGMECGFCDGLHLGHDERWAFDTLTCASLVRISTSRTVFRSAESQLPVGLGLRVHCEAFCRAVLQQLRDRPAPMERSGFSTALTHACLMACIQLCATPATHNSSYLNTCTQYPEGSQCTGPCWVLHHVV